MRIKDKKERREEFQKYEKETQNKLERKQREYDRTLKEQKERSDKEMKQFKVPFDTVFYYSTLLSFPESIQGGSVFSHNFKSRMSRKTCVKTELFQKF